LRSSGDPDMFVALQPTLSPADRRRLKGQAQLLESVLKVGHAGVTPAFLASVEQELSLRGLIKIKFTDRKEEKRALSEQIAQSSGSELLQIVGHVAVFYRPKPPKKG
jgi:RNA-binding protein